MRMLEVKNGLDHKASMNGGFTLIEVIIAGGIMIILCIGTLTVFSHASKINSGNNLRAQAQSVLQKEAEYYRSLKFIPVGSDPILNGQTETNEGTRSSADNQTFVVYVTIDDNPSVADVQIDSATKFKEITIRAVPQTTQTGWLSDASLNTKLVIQRVRAN